MCVQNDMFYGSTNKPQASGVDLLDLLFTSNILSVTLLMLEPWLYARIAMISSIPRAHANEHAYSIREKSQHVT